jgi:hypothetical protein
MYSIKFDKKPLLKLLTEKIIWILFYKIQSKMKNNFPTFFIILITLSLLTQSARALTYNEIVAYQTGGRVLGASTTGLVGYWNFDEGSGTTAADSSGNGNNGTLTNGPTWTAGKVGSGALSFDGTNNYVNAGSNSSLDDIQNQGGSGMTVAFWINPASNSTKYIIGKGLDSTNTGHWSVVKSNLTNPARIVFKKEGGTDLQAYWNNIAPSGSWTHVVVVWDGAMDGSGVNLYKNGTLVVGKGITPGATANSDAANNLSIGSSNGTSGYLDAGLDEVRIYNRVLTAQEIQDIYNDTGSPPGGGSPPPAGDTTAPSVPASLTATSISFSQINLSWTASTDNVGVTGYKIYRGGVEIGTTVNNNYNDNNLNVSTAYSYTVSAFDAVGNNSAQSSAAGATTQTPAPPPSGNYPWSGILDTTRAIDWTGAGFTIPNYTTNCPTQPLLTPNDPSAAAANTTAIQNALASCDATHNVVNIPAGNFYVAGIIYGSQGKQMIRGAGPMLTTLTPTAVVACGFWMAICMTTPTKQSHTMAAIPPSGHQQCAWTAGYAKGSTAITLSNCPGGGPPVNSMLILDQKNDSADTGGLFICDDTSFADCAYTGAAGQDADGRVIGGVAYSQQQVVLVTADVNNGDGTYSVSISHPVYFDNVRSGQSPGAYWLSYVQNDGLENLTVDHGYLTSGPNGNWTAIQMYDCYQCWVRNVRNLNGSRADVFIGNSLDDVVRDNYFYGAQHGTSQSYAIEFEEASGVLVENNIFQQVTVGVMFGQGSGNVTGYNYSIDNFYGGSSIIASYDTHNAGNEFNLGEGNNFGQIGCDDLHGSSGMITMFRNIVIGWQSGKTQSTYPIYPGAKCRAFNFIGNAIGQPNITGNPSLAPYHTIYDSYATSTTSGVNGGNAATRQSIYVSGWTGLNGAGGCLGLADLTAGCDPLVYSTLMRWGNYDVASAYNSAPAGGIRWDAGEASPAAVSYVNANFTPSYFSSLAHTLPASLYYTSRPSWWPTAKAWPPVGPDVSNGNLGICSGTYAGAQATNSSQCTGGTLSTAYAGHANSIPAQDCYLNVMHGPPDGTGGVLNFDANNCYYGGTPDTTPPAAPTGMNVQ